MTRWKKFLIILSVIGPGIITANIDNDAGGIATYSIAGAHFGYSLLWTLIPTTIALIVVQEMAARMGAVTGKGLADLIRENYGVKITFWLMVALFITDLGNTAAEFAGWAASAEILGINKYIAVPLGAIFVWVIVVKGSYRIFEKIFLFVCVVYIVYIPSAVLAKPDWSQVAIQTIKPSFQFSSAYIVTFIGLIGTTITPWMQFYLQSAVVEKGIKKDNYWASRIDVIFGCFMTDIIAFFIVVACGATLFKAGVKISSAEEAAVALAPIAGKYASILFAIGLANASLFSASILPLATAYYICEGMGWEAGVNKTFKDAPQFMWLYTFLIAVGSLIILIPGAPLIAIMWISQVINGIMLPFVLIFMLSLINKPELMGDYMNSKTFNRIAWTTAIIMIALTGMFIITLFV
ncbi:Mn transporter [Dissulfurispira thermophila]|uniref:Mn transporter n=1 Tax=Dissulfurispira thermophila TaxID=2715679 RepID=A0A7G1GXR1_9BACT|nr:Nramp family divalent metal transporter [Dissulfurispira thermophila]BCB95115.1 Mn transporter [Dissulfurispira thermophila]